MINAYVARAGMEIINALGPANIRAWHAELGRRLIDGGRSRGLVLQVGRHARKTATTAFIFDDPHAVELGDA